MKVFIGWAGETSRQVAAIFKDWLSGMFDGHVSAFTPDDIAMGSRWFETLDDAMASADCALLCVTGDNVNSPWLAYEAGALSRNVKFMVPILFGVSSLSLSYPLRMFQPISFDFDGMRKLAYELNGLCGEERIPSDELERRLAARYPALETLLEEKLRLSASKSKDADDWKRAVSELESKLDAILSRLPESPRSPAGGLEKGGTAL